MNDLQKKSLQKLRVFWGALLKALILAPPTDQLADLTDLDQKSVRSTSRLVGRANISAFSNAPARAVTRTLELLDHT